MIWEHVQNPHDRVQRAMRKLAENPNAQFWGFVGLNMPLVPRDDLNPPTMATDGKAIYYAPSYVMGITETRCIATLAHEISHPALQHFDRLVGRWPQDIANMAADYELNLDLRKAGFDIGDDWLIDDRFEGLAAEQIAHVITKENEQAKTKQQQAGQPGQPGQLGSDNGLPHQEQSGRMMEPKNDDGTSMSGQQKAELADQWAERTAQALGAARKAGLIAGGHIPAALVAVKETLTAPALVDWRIPLRQFIDALGSRYSTYAKLSRRGMSRGLALPGSKVIRPSVIGWLTDISGSMDITKNEQAAIEAQAALDDGACDAIEIVYVNTVVMGVERYERGETIKLKTATSGGTNFRSAMAYAADQDYAAIVFITDGHTADWGTDPSVPVLWGITDTQAATDALSPPFGEKLCLYTSR